MRLSESRIRVVAALIIAGGLAACALAILAKELGQEGARTRGWDRITLLAAGGRGDRNAPRTSARSLTDRVQARFLTARAGRYVRG